MNSHNILFTIFLLKYVLMTEAGTLKEQTGNLNATFPCGDPETGQRCKIPFEFCDTILESCMSCNVDICRENSRPSCNIFCDDTRIEKEISEKHSNKPSSDYKTAFYVTLGVLIAIVLGITAKCIAMVIQRIRGTRGEDLPDQRDMRPIANPTD